MKQSEKETAFEHEGHKSKTVTKFELSI